MNTHSLSRRFTGTLVSNLVSVIALFSLAGCGSTSALQNPQGQALTSAKKFSKVIVMDFKMKLEEPEPNSKEAPTYFPDRISHEIRTKSRFTSVGRNSKPDANTLVIDGIITKFHE